MSEFTKDRTFLGMPIRGDINEGRKRENQRPLSELQPLLQAVLDDPTVEEFGWSQYTPYFNDGDPCEFSVHGAWVKLVGGERDDINYPDQEPPPLGKIPHTWDRQTREHIYGEYEGPDKARYDRCHALANAVESSAFEDVLLAAFGDHAEVTVTRDGIDVEFYEHD